MNSVLIAALAFLAAIALLITIHEAGHFWVARRLGVRVLRFSIGFGSPLWQRVGRDGTEYRIAAIPLGGYVKMLDEREGPVPEEERHRAFNRQSLKVRSAIVLAGPLANFLFAVVAYWLILMIGVTGARPLVGDITPGSAADAAGLRHGDLIVAVNDRDTPTWQEAGLALVDSALGSRSARLQLEGEDGARRQTELDMTAVGRLEEPGDLLRDLGLEPLQPRLSAVLAEPLPEGPARDAGLVPGDRIIALNGEAVSDWQGLVEQVRARPGERVAMEVERDGSRRSVEIMLAAREDDTGEYGFLGAAPEIPEGLFEQFYVTHREGALAAIPGGVQRTVEMSGLTLRMLWRMVTGDVSLKNISGPINIAHFAGQSASIGLVPFLAFLAIVSISLGIINLLPVPVLDGGHLLYFLVEAVKGSPLSERAEIVGQQIGILMLIGLMTLAFYNDLARLMG